MFYSYIVFERLRDGRGLKDADVVKGAGVEPWTLSDWKRGKSEPKGDKVYCIANFFGVPMEEFYKNGSGTDED